MKINITDLTKVINNKFIALENESVVVGVLTGKQAALPNYKMTRRLPNDRSGTTVVRPQRRRSKLKLKQLAKFLDANPLFRIFSNPMITGRNRFAQQVAEQFANLTKTPNDIKRLENACRAMIRNPILTAQYRATNDPAYSKLKHGAPYGIATGELFTNITAHFRGARK